MGQVSQLETVIEQVEATAAIEAAHAQEIRELHETERVMLESQLKQKEEALLGKDSAIRQLAGGFSGKLSKS
jgi:hypothetical protein